MKRQTIPSAEARWRSAETARLLREKTPPATIAPQEATRALMLLADALQSKSEPLRRRVFWSRGIIFGFLLLGMLVTLLGSFFTLRAWMVSAPALVLAPFLVLMEDLLGLHQRRLLRCAATYFSAVAEGAAVGPVLVVLAEADRVLRGDVFPVLAGWEALARLAPKASAQDLQNVPAWALAFLARELSAGFPSTSVWRRPIFGPPVRHVYRERPEFLVTALLLLSSAQFPDGIEAARRLAKEFPDERVREAARSYLRAVGEA